MKEMTLVLNLVFKILISFKTVCTYYLKGAATCGNRLQLYSVLPMIVYKHLLTKLW